METITYEYLTANLTVDPTSPSGLRWKEKGVGRRKDLRAGSRNCSAWQVFVQGRITDTRRVIKALTERTDLAPTPVYSASMPLAERFKIDPDSPSGLTWLVDGPGFLAGDVAGSKKPNGYYRIGSTKPSLQVHRVVCELAHGPIPEGFEVDHKDRNPSNNAPDNVRAVDKSQNGFNKLGGNTAWFPKGINMNKHTGQVQAIITKDRKQYRPGTSFKESSDPTSEKLNALTAATLEALIELHGEHGCYDSFYSQLPIEAVLGQSEGYP